MCASWVGWCACVCMSQEAELFASWLAERRSAAAEASRQVAELEEDDLLVGPALPGAAGQKDKDGGNYGGFLRPGEGERCARAAEGCCSPPPIHTHSARACSLRRLRLDGAACGLQPACSGLPGS